MGKYDSIESGWSLDSFPAIEKPPTIVPPPRNVACVPRLLSSNDGSNIYTLDVAWLFPVRADGVTREAFVTNYYVEFRRGDGTWGNRQDVSQLSARYENVGAGSFYARVAAVVTANGKVSQWVESTAGTLTTVQAVADFQVAGDSAWAVDW